VGDIIRHLHLWNIAADLSLNDPDGFITFMTQALTEMNGGGGHIQFQNNYFKSKTSAQVFQDWRESYLEIAHRFQSADPEKRVKWAGPDMSVRSSIIARQMEHWAHAQAIFDLLGIERKNEDRIKNVAHLGVTTF